MNDNYSCENKEKEALYRVGLFSQMNRVTVKTLRHYDDIGLLKPNYIDETNGYRYYTSKQLPVLHQIISLRQMGMTLDEIRKIQEGDPIHKILLSKKSELLKSIAEDTMKLSQVEYYLIHKGEDDGYSVVIKELPEVITACMRTVIADYNVLFELMPSMGLELERLGCFCAVPEYCFNIYHDGGYKEENIDAEICQAVTEIKENSKMLTFKTIPRVETAACVLHRGAYENFPKAYGALLNWMEENQYELSSPPREAYIDGVWNKDDVNDWLTEIQFPLKRKGKQVLHIN